MNILLLILSFLIFSTFGYGQIKSIKQVVYFIDTSSEKESYSNDIKDSTIRILERFDELGNLIYEQDFPSDRLWRNNGAWEHDYLYDKDSRIIKHKEYYHSENGEKVLMNEYFYSYPDLIEPHIANEILVSYNFRDTKPILRRQIDTVTYVTINTKDLLVSELKTWLEYDTISHDFGNFIFRKDISYSKNLFDINQFIRLLESKSNREFENILKINIVEISIYLEQLHLSNTSYFTEFEVFSSESPRSIGIKVSDNFIEIFNNEYDKKGNKTRTAYYKYYLLGKELLKNTITRNYIEYYK